MDLLPEHPVKRVGIATLALVAMFMAGCSTANTPSNLTTPVTSATGASDAATPTTLVLTSTSTNATAVVTAELTAPVTTETPARTSEAVVGATSAPVDNNTYLDDRSNPERLMASFVNALNRKEYVRAYSYWENTPQLMPYQKFKQGYANTKSVQFALGSITSDAGAGQFHYYVPVVFHAVTTDGTAQTFVGCYLMHLANPSIQGVPPFLPLAITSATVQALRNDADTNALIRQTCKPNP